MGYTIYYDGELTVKPALSKSDAAIFATIVNQQTSEAAQPILDAISLLEDVELPYYGGLLELSEDGATILPEDGESSLGVAAWLGILIPRFFSPRGYEMSGHIAWSAEDDSTDRGVIYVDGGRIEVIEDFIENPGPSWAPSLYMADKVKEMIKNLVDSASDEGCSPDLTVVSAAELKALKDSAAEEASPSEVDSDLAVA